MRHHGTGSVTRLVAPLAVLMAIVICTLAAYQTRTLASHVAANSSIGLRDVGPFEATIYQGPDKGMSFTGELKLRLTTKAGELTGMLVPASGQAVPVTGQLNGAAINLIFYLGSGKHLFGVGTIGRDPGAKQLVIGGPLVGPGKGDSGDWGILSSAGAAVADFLTGFYKAVS